MSFILRLSLIILILLAFNMPMFIYDNGLIEKGWVFFIFGWLGTLDGNFAWFASIPFVVACFLQNRRPKLAALSAGVSLLLGMTIFNYGVAEAIDSAKSSKVTIGVAAYFWLGAIFIMFTLSVINFLRLQNSQQSE